MSGGFFLKFLIKYNSMNLVIIHIVRCLQYNKHMGLNSELVCSSRQQSGLAAPPLMWSFLSSKTFPIDFCGKENKALAASFWDEAFCDDLWGLIKVIYISNEKKKPH